MVCRVVSTSAGHRGLIGFACGTVFFPIFLVPLWANFYGRKGARAFLGAWGAMLVLSLLSLLLVSIDSTSFFRQTISAIDWTSLSFNPRTIMVSGRLLNLLINSCHRSISGRGRLADNLASAEKLEHLIANSAALIVGTQFWYPQQGGIYILWYLPLVLLIVFRPYLHHQDPPGYEETDSERKATPDNRAYGAAGIPHSPPGREQEVISRFANSSLIPEL
ncbi:MAG: hypothetical protein R3C11_19185 [Planctomycetaceae bacterium]